MPTSAGHPASARTREPRWHTGRARLENRPIPMRADGRAATPTMSSPPSHRDLAVLRAVAAGRCEMSGVCGGSLTIDGLGCCDQFVGPRLASAGLIAAGPRPGPVRLTDSGRALLGMA